MESVPQLIETYHLKELRAEWEELDMRDVNLPPEVEMLMKDQALLERLKNLLTRFIEIEEANQYKAYEESLKQSETTTISDTESELPSEILLPEDTHGSPTPPSRNSVHFEVLHLESYDMYQFLHNTLHPICLANIQGLRLDNSGHQMSYFC